MIIRVQLPFRSFSQPLFPIEMKWNQLPPLLVNINLKWLDVVVVYRRVVVYFVSPILYCTQLNEALLYIQCAHNTAHNTQKPNVFCPLILLQTPMNRREYVLRYYHHTHYHMAGLDKSIAEKGKIFLFYTHGRSWW